jgi:teichuronic acid exporter
LHAKIVTSFLWSAVNTGGSQMLGLIFGILLARLLSPESFGLMAILVFISLIANVFVDSGLSDALIRDQNVTKLDYDSVFYFSVLVALICSIFVYVSSEFLANFYNNPILDSLIKVMSISPLLYALMAINGTIMTKNLDFKLKAKLGLSAMLIAGFLGIFMAKNGYGIWSLVTMQLLNPFLLMVFMWLKVKWRPRLNFSYQSIIKHMQFGIKISISNLAKIIYTKSYVLIIGKHFSVIDAGYFARADSLKNLPAGMLSKIIARVAYPTLSKIQNNSNTLRSTNALIIKYTAVISIPIMIGMASVSEELLVTLIGEKWLPSAQILLYLCFAGVLLPFDTINMNIIKVQGRMTSYLTLELVKIFLIIPVLCMGVFIGMKEMLISIIVHAGLSFIISATVSGKLINYSLSEYILDIWQPVVFSLLMFFIVNFIKNYLDYSYFYELLISVTFGFFAMVICYEVFKNNEYKNIKQWVLSRGNDS